MPTHKTAPRKPAPETAVARKLAPRKAADADARPAKRVDPLAELIGGKPPSRAGTAAVKRARRTPTPVAEPASPVVAKTPAVTAAKTAARKGTRTVAKKIANKVAQKAGNKAANKAGNKAAKPVAHSAARAPVAAPLSRHRPPDDMALEDWQAALRRDFGVVQDFGWRNLGSEPFFSDFEVHNPASGGRYRVTVRGLERGVNRCTCADFASNELGTCKHVEFVLGRLQAKRGAKAAFAAGATPTFSEVVLHHGARRCLRWHPGSACPPALQDKALALLDATGELPPDNDEALPQLVQLAAAAGHELRIDDSAWAHVAAHRDARWRVHRLEHLYPQGPGSAALQGLLKAPLLPYQAEGAMFAVCAGRCLIADDMGLGKTVQAIAAAELLLRHFGVERVLVVCPTSLKHQWQREWQRFAGRDSRVVQGPPALRREQYGDALMLKITNFESLERDADLIKAFDADLVIVDEAQRIKNWNTIAARALKRIEAPYAVVLTGTPLENRLEELLSIVQFVDPNRLGPTWRFLHEHQQRDDGGRVVGYVGLDQIGHTLESVMIRRRKAEVLQQLPERLDQTRLVPLTAEQRRLHDDNGLVVSRIVQRWRRTGYLSDADQRRLTCALQNMRRVCISSFLLDPAGGDHGSKLDELALLLAELLERPEAKVVVFSTWLGTHELIERRLQAAGVASVRFSGDVPAEQRAALVQRFHEDPDCRVFLSTDAGSVGLNLQHAAAIVVNMDLPWNPAVLEQRIGRVHRLGQSRGVQVINLVAQASIEEGMLGTLAFKRDLAAGVLDGGAADVFLHGTRLTRFMEEVEQASGVLTPPAEVADRVAAHPAALAETADVPTTPGTAALPPREPAPAAAALDWRPLLGVAAAWLQSLAQEPAAAPRWQHDAASGQAGLFVPVPGDAALREQLAGALRGLARGLSPE